jgi:hypothetical protein
MRWLRHILYWLAVVAIAAALAYGVVLIAEGLDASRVGAATGAALSPHRLATPLGTR